MAKTIPPVIKWSGSKRPQAQQLSNWFPSEYDTYYEPFVGGGALLPYQKANKGAVASDVMPELISLWQMLQQEPQSVKIGYRVMWNTLQLNHDYYYEVRDRFNEDRDPIDFFFLLRTCYNGLCRFNSHNEFNVSYHLTRPGMNPDRMDRIISTWSTQYLPKVQFKQCDYRNLLEIVDSRDFVFLDPPYYGTKAQYGPRIADFNYDDFEAFLADLNQIGVKWLLTLGTSDKYDLPAHLHVGETSTEPFSSSFRRLKSVQVKTGDKVYTNYALPT